MTGKTHGMDASDFAEDKQAWHHVMSAMERQIRRSHPYVGYVGSQAGEDAILASLLPQSGGIYVDVGAGEPVNTSNTWKFYQRGWRGLLVECLPSNWSALLHQRPGDFLSPYAAYDSDGFADLRVCNSVSSVRPDWDIQEQGILCVECRTLMNILAPFPQIRDHCDLLSLDVEGSEARVINAVDWNVFRPRVIVIEMDRYHGSNAARKAWFKANPGKVDDLSAEWHGTLNPHYRLHETTSLNRIYVRR